MFSSKVLIMIICWTTIDFLKYVLLIHTIIQSTRKTRGYKELALLTWQFIYIGSCWFARKKCCTNVLDDHWLSRFSSEFPKGSNVKQVWLWWLSWLVSEDTRYNSENIFLKSLVPFGSAFYIKKILVIIFHGISCQTNFCCGSHLGLSVRWQIVRDLTI